MICADKIYFNGKFHTMKAEDDVVEAIAVYDGKIVCTGSTYEMLNIPCSEKVDLKGKHVLPGFIDTHMHLYMDCLDRLKIDLSGAGSFQDVISLLKRGLKNIGDGGWLMGENLHMDWLTEGRFPPKEVLDEVSGDIPICIGSFCRHAHILNTRAMEICGIGPGFVEPITGTVDLGEDGAPNGTIREATYDRYVTPHIPAGTLDKNIGILDDYLGQCSAAGLTTLHAYQGDNPDGFRLYQEIDRKVGLKCRIVMNPAMKFPTDLGMVTGFGSDKLKLGAAKYLIDGSVGAASALMQEPYSDLPDKSGVMVLDQAALDQAVKQAYDAGMDVAVHAIGDRANDMLLTAIEKIYDPSIGWNRRFYIIHATIIDDGFIERAKKLPVILCMQPIFIRNFVDMVQNRIGPERARRCFALKSFYDAGLIVTGGSDAPVREINPLNGIQCAVTRRDIGDNPEEVAPDEAISVYQAVGLYTRNAAYCAQEEKIKGTLEKGKLADFVVLDDDIFTVKPDRISEIKIIRTVLGGDTVYDRGE